MMRLFKLIVWIGWPLLLIGCAENPAPSPVNEAPGYFPSASGSWETVDPGLLGWKTEELPALRNYLDEKNSKAFIVLYDGRLALEWYFDAFTRDSIWYWASAGKTLTAFLIGQAQEKGLVLIDQPVSTYLGEGWTSLNPGQEQMITVRHQLTMTTGLDDAAGDPDCTLPGCLQYKSDPGTRWAYHNAPYTLLGKVLENSSGLTRNAFTSQNLSHRIGMTGLWLKLGFNEIYFSNARSMARFGHLVLNNGVWNGDTLLHDRQYMMDMVQTSQDINPSYGYLWWLNGKGSYRVPQLQIEFTGDLVPNAPNEMVCALGKNDQKIYLLPSRKIVVIRMGHSAGQPLFALSSFDNELWGELSKIFD